MCDASLRQLSARQNLVLVLFWVALCSQITNNVSGFNVHESEVFSAKHLLNWLYDLFSGSHRLCMGSHDGLDEGDVCGEVERPRLYEIHFRDHLTGVVFHVHPQSWQALYDRPVAPICNTYTPTLRYNPISDNPASL